MTRCSWASTPELTTYHDTEWGVPVHDDRTLFEFLTLEGAQAGLSWATVLRKRDRYREQFAHFDAVGVARFTPATIEKLLLDPGIIRNRAKVLSTVDNARLFLEVVGEHGSFDAYLWRFVDGEPAINTWTESSDVPVSNAQSEALSADLRKRGFRFVGPTIMYAFMQATGMINDHLVSCFRHAELA